LSDTLAIAHVRKNANGAWAASQSLAEHLAGTATRAGIGITSTVKKLASCGGKQVYNGAKQNEAKMVNSSSRRYADSHFINHPKAEREWHLPEGFLPSRAHLFKGEVK